jgi:hypothetical protein
MLSELTRAIYDSSGMDWQTAEKITYTVLVFLEKKMTVEDFNLVKRYMLGDVEYKLPDRSIYPGYAGELPDQART